MIILCHPTGNENSRQAALALASAGALHKFYTALNWPAHHWSTSILPGGLRRQLQRRSFDPAISDRMCSVPWFDTLRLANAALRQLWPRVPDYYPPVRSGAALSRFVASRLSSLPTDVSAVYAYESAAQPLFREAEKLGLDRIYELPSVYWKEAIQILDEEAELQPAWRPTRAYAAKSNEYGAAKDLEIDLAGPILVASTFAKASVVKYHPAKADQLRLVPYGGPPASARSADELHAPTRKLRILFVGSLSLHKGLPYLFAAIAELRSVAEVTIVGQKNCTCKVLEDGLQQVKWLRSLAHAEVLEEMRRADILLLPSLFEGFGLVILEAMARGCVVIASSHTAGADVIESGVDGFVVPIRSSEAIVEHVLRLDNDRSLLARMKEAALAGAQRRSWAAYRARLVEALDL